MEYSLVLLLLTIARVQGYSNDLNGTTSGSYVSSEDSQHKQFNQKDFDRVFEHYRSEGGRSREPRFVSFNTKDDNIEVEIGKRRKKHENCVVKSCSNSKISDFAIPFLSIPVKRSLSGAMGTLQNVIRVSDKYCGLVVNTFVEASFDCKFRVLLGHPDGQHKFGSSFADWVCSRRGRNDWRNFEAA
jgi:hypothetical protein